MINAIEQVWGFLKTNHDAVLALVAIISCLTATYATRLQISISRSQRIADSRVRWIETLRSNISTYTTSCRRLATIVATADNRGAIEAGKFLDLLIEKISELEHLRSSISLSLNLEENYHNELNNLLVDMLKLTYEIFYKYVENKPETKISDIMDKLQDKRGEINKTARLIFKQEWHKAKAGT